MTGHSVEGLEDIARGPDTRGHTVWGSIQEMSRAGDSRDRKRILGCWGLRRERWWFMGWVTWELGSHMMSQLKKTQEWRQNQVSSSHAPVQPRVRYSHRGPWSCSGHHAGVWEPMG